MISDKKEKKRKEGHECDYAKGTYCGNLWHNIFCYDGVRTAFEAMTSTYHINSEIANPYISGM